MGATRPNVFELQTCQSVQGTAQRRVISREDYDGPGHTKYNGLLTLLVMAMN